MGGGGSISSTNPMCDLALGIELTTSIGDTEATQELVDIAVKYAKSRASKFHRIMNYIPLINKLF